MAGDLSCLCCPEVAGGDHALKLPLLRIMWSRALNDEEVEQNVGRACVTGPKFLWVGQKLTVPLVSSGCRAPMRVSIPVTHEDGVGVVCMLLEVVVDLLPYPAICWHVYTKDLASGCTGGAQCDSQHMTDQIRVLVVSMNLYGSFRLPPFCAQPIKPPLIQSVVADFACPFGT